ANSRPCGTGEFHKRLRIACDKKHRVANAEAELVRDHLRALRPDVLGERACTALLALAPKDVAEARLTLALRPRIHPVAEGTIAAALRGDRPDRIFRIGRENVGEDLKSGAAEGLAHICH